MNDLPCADVGERRPALLRALGPGVALAIVVDNVIGSGIFYKPGTIAAAAGDVRLILAAWIAGGVVCLLGALCFAELATMLPRAGGLYVYLREAYGRPVGFLFGWTEVLFGKPASTGALAVAFVGVLNEAGRLNLSLSQSAAVAVLLIMTMAWINILGVVWGGRVVATTMLIKAGFLAVLGLLPFVLALNGTSALSVENYRSVLPEPLETTFSAQWAAAMLAVLWAYNGWHGITPVAEEIKHPERNIPLALFGGIGLLIVLYVGANVAYHGVLSMNEMAQAGQSVPQAMIRKLLSPWGSGTVQAGVAVISAVMLCSTFGAINSNLLNVPRVSFAMGRDDVFFRSLGWVHVHYRTPAVAIAVMGLMASALVIGTTVLVSTVGSLKETTTVFKMLTDFVVFSASLFYMLAVLAVIVLRIRRPDWHRPYRTLGYPVVPLAYLAFYVWFLYHVYNGDADSRFSANIGLCLVALGVPAWFAWQAWTRLRPGQDDAARPAEM